MMPSCQHLREYATLMILEIRAFPNSFLCTKFLEVGSPRGRVFIDIVVPHCIPIF